MHIDVLTLFPELFPGPLGASVVGRAAERDLATVGVVNVRDFAADRRGTVDEKPYGGGPGMLMMVEPLTLALESVRRQDSVVVMTTPRGERFSQKLARELAECRHLVLVAGHYEGVDERFLASEVDREVSLGDYVLSNGNLAAMVIADAVIRLLPGVLGDDASSCDESHSGGLLEYPQYTRPEEFRGRRVPEVLLSGDHGKIEKWRRAEAEKLTRERRPDLWEKYLQQTKEV